MYLDKPEIEYVEVDNADIVTTSSGTGGVDSCKGDASRGRNCTYFGESFMAHDGIYDSGNS